MGRIQKIVLTDAVAKILRPALGNDESIIIEQINAGVCELFKCDEVYFITRGEGNELVIVALAGKNLRNVTELIFSTAKKAGFKSIRYHTKRPALAKLFAQYNPREVERVFRIEV